MTTKPDHRGVLGPVSRDARGFVLAGILLGDGLHGHVGSEHQGEEDGHDARGNDQEVDPFSLELQVHEVPADHPRLHQRQAHQSGNQEGEVVLEDHGVEVFDEREHGEDSPDLHVGSVRFDIKLFRDVG